MNVVIDTNVVMDTLTDRKPFADASTEAIALAGDKGCNVAITANTVTDLYFLLRRHFSNSVQAKATLLRLVKTLTVLDTTRELCLLAFDSPVSDFEDAVLVESAIRWGADCIVTRNTSDFAASPIEAIEPSVFISRLTT